MKSVLGIGVLLVTVGMWAQGILPRSLDPFFPVALGLLGLLLWYFVRYTRGVFLEKISLVIIASALTLIGADLLLRAVLFNHFFPQPDKHLLRPWPSLPLVYRYDANVVFSEETYGNLASLLGDRNLREPRPLLFETDAFGFRNTPRQPAAPYEVIVVGDSYGLGAGTTQDATWVSLLQDRYQLALYNLSVSGSPWQGYVNLATEIQRIEMRAPATVLLMLFSGNDLDEYYDDERDLAALPWNNAFQRFQVSFATYRERSVLRGLRRGLVLWLGHVGVPGFQGEASEVLVKEFNGKPLLFYKPYLDSNTGSEEAFLNHPNYVLLQRTLHDLKALTDRRGLRLKIVLAPSKADVYRWVVDDLPAWTSDAQPSHWATMLRTVCKALRVECLDLTPTLIAASRQGFETSGALLWWYDDTHWNVHGNKVVATAIYEHLLRDGAAPSTAIPVPASRLWTRP